MALGGCDVGSPPTVPPTLASPSVTDVGIAGPWDNGGPLDVEWLDDQTLVVIRGNGEFNRQRAVQIDLGSMESTPMELDAPEGCISVDVQNPKVIGGRLFLDRRCFAVDGNDSHDIMLIHRDGPAEKVAAIPWFPDSYVELPSGAWLSGFDSGPCAWIDLVPSTGQPGIPWPIMVTDDGAPFAINASPKGDCDHAVLASSIDRNSDGLLAFVAAGSARTAKGLARLDVPANVYVVPETGGDARRIASGLVEARNVRWAPDGSSVIVIARAGPGSALLRIDLAGTENVLYQGGPVVATWAPDGRRIALIIQNASENRILILKVDR